MKDKCLNCPFQQYKINNNKNQICYDCGFKDASIEFNETFKETQMYKFMIKLLDWLENKLEKYWK